MNTSKDTGGPAFPTTQYAGGVSPSGHAHGMTLRDYFAAKAMQGILASGKEGSWGNFAYWAYTVADAMLEERK